MVDAGPPEGWSHRVIRSRPKLASGELASLPESAQVTATLLRTVITVDVVGRGSAYRLARVGVGNAVPVGGREVVVTSDGCELLTRFPADQLYVAGTRLFTGADLAAAGESP